MEFPRQQTRPRRRQVGRRGYELIVRGPDGRPQSERFDDAAAYRERLNDLARSECGSVSIDEIASLLDP
jgi:hypothetical protein